jgi:DNA-binding beta-propeller fold protein YncE
MKAEFRWSLAVAATTSALAVACGSSPPVAQGTSTGAGSSSTTPSTGGNGDAGGSADAGGAGGGGAEPTPIVDAIPGVVVSTLAGSSVAGEKDGSGSEAQFDNPVNVALDPNGSLVVCDFDGGRLRRVTGNVVTTLTMKSGFARPFGVAFGPSGALFVQTDTDPTGNHQETDGTIWSVDPATGAAKVVVADVGWPRGIAVRADGRLVLADRHTHTLLVLDAASGALTLLAGSSGTAGFADGKGKAAQFNNPYGLAFDAQGNAVVADRMNNRLRLVTPAGDVTTLAGDGAAGMVDGPAREARFHWPQDVAIDGAGNVFVTDLGNHRIRRLDTSGIVRTVAGDGAAGYRDGAGTDAQFFGQEGIDVTADGKTVYVADGSLGDPQPYHRLRKIEVP